MTVIQGKKKINGSNLEISDPNWNFFYCPMRDWRGRRMGNVLEDKRAKPWISLVAFALLMPVTHGVERLLVNSEAEICTLQRHKHLSLKW